MFLPSSLITFLYTVDYYFPIISINYVHLLVNQNTEYSIPLHYTRTLISTTHLYIYKSVADVQ